jgi:hypothetical protein
MLAPYRVPIPRGIAAQTPRPERQLDVQTTNKGSRRLGAKGRKREDKERGDIYR